MASLAAADEGERAVETTHSIKRRHRIELQALRKRHKKERDAATKAAKSKKEKKAAQTELKIKHREEEKNDRSACLGGGKHGETCSVKGGGAHERRDFSCCVRCC